MTAEHLTLSRRGITVGLSQVRASQAPRPSSHPPGSCWNACATAKPTCCGSSPTPPSPPTSNQAERDLRPSKTQQKISGRLRSEKTTRDRYAIRGYASTAAKHGIAVFTAIRDALAGNPWIPPIPATA
jgi:transposase